MSKISDKDKEIEKSDPLWLKIAKREIGESEVLGPDSNPRIIEYGKAVTLDVSEDSIPWCSSFVNWCLKQSGLKGTGSAAARSWLKYGNPLDIPHPGAICILWRDNPASWKGHVGFFVKQDDKYLYLLGGNQSNKVNVSRYPKDRLLGYRWPRDL